MPAVRRAARVRQEDDRRLKSLAGVDGQYPDAFGLDLHVALDFGVGRFDLGEKIMQRRRFTLLMRQRQGQEFVDRVGGFGSEPADQRSPAAVLAQEKRVERERRDRLRAPPPSGEQTRRLGREEVVRGRERLGQRTAPPRSELEEGVVTEPDQRRLEGRGQRQIVVRQQRRASGGDEVHHRDVVLEHEAVGAGGLEFSGLEGSHHRLEEGVAAANQNHHVAFANAPDLAGHGVDHALE